jgi:hypothetical protein
MHLATGRKVVVLVDEYDKPITDHLSNLEAAETNRRILHTFYQVLKAADDHLRFIFLTGVSKFSKVSIFSGLNSLRDITMSNEFSAICGYTQTELESCFDAHIEQLAEEEEMSRSELLDKIKFWYNGYSWDGVTPVYNPFSTLLLFTEKRFSDYWFASGTPTFLVNLIKEHNDVEIFLKPSKIYASDLNSYDYSQLNAQQLLFQTGYLTVKQVTKAFFENETVYNVGVPNEEVHIAMTKYLVGSYVDYPVPKINAIRDAMAQQLYDANPVDLECGLQEMFARIPYQLHVPREAYYHSLMLLWLNLLGFKVDAELPTDKGRLDAVWTWGDRVVIAEVKYSAEETPDALIEKAFAQIRARRYHERYAGEGKQITLLAVAFAGKEIACSMEALSENDTLRK